MITGALQGFWGQVAVFDLLTCSTSESFVGGGGVGLQGLGEGYCCLLAALHSSLVIPAFRNSSKGLYCHACFIVTLHRFQVLQVFGFGGFVLF